MSSSFKRDRDPKRTQQAKRLTLTRKRQRALKASR